MIGIFIFLYKFFQCIKISYYSIQLIYLLILQNDLDKTLECKVKMATLPSSRALNNLFWGLSFKDVACLGKLESFVFKALLYSHYSKLSSLGCGNIDFNKTPDVNFELKHETPTKGMFVDCLLFIILPVFILVVFV